MPQIINESSLLSNLGQSLGQGVGGGIGQLLSSHIASKARKYEQGVLAEKLASLLGGNIQQARAIAALEHPGAQQRIISDLLNSQNQGQRNEALGMLLAGNPAQQQIQEQESQPEENILQQQPQLQTSLQALTGKKPSFTEQQMLQSLVPGKQQQIKPMAKEKQHGGMNDQLSKIDRIREAARRGLISPQILLAAEKEERQREENQQKIALQREKLQLQKEQTQSRFKTEEKKISQQEQSRIDKETLPTYNEITKEAKAAKGNLKRLNRMEELIKEGVAYPLYASALKTISNGIFGFGIDLTSLLDANSQEFDKLSTDFVKDAKSFFGNRLTDADLKAFLKTVPTLSMSDSGKERVIKSLRSFSDAALIKRKALDDIIRENNGKRPSNLDELLDKRTADQLDPLSKEIKKNISAPISIK